MGSIAVSPLEIRRRHEECLRELQPYTQMLCEIISRDVRLGFIWHPKTGEIEQLPYPEATQKLVDEIERQRNGVIAKYGFQ